MFCRYLKRKVLGIISYLRDMNFLRNKILKMAMGKGNKILNLARKIHDSLQPTGFYYITVSVIF
jgi:hypothetical protein